MSNQPEIRASLPVHDVTIEQGAGPHLLKIDGLVSKSIELSLADLERLPQQDLTNDFICAEGWSVPDVRWRGVPLKAVLSLAGVAAEARYVQASSGKFSLPLPLEQIGVALLALQLNGSTLTREHGGPVRLVVPGGECFTSVKWLDHLELRREPGENTAKTIALGRLASDKSPAHLRPEAAPPVED